MTLSEAWRRVPLGESGRHAEALTLMATRMLRVGDIAGAFEFIDRRCRLAEPASASDHAIRALAAHLAGRPAQADLCRAAAADPLDPFLATIRLRLSADETEALSAATSIARSPAATASARRAALSRVFSSGTRALAVVEVVDDRLSGFVAWAAGTPPTLSSSDDNAQHEASLAADPAFPLAGDGTAGCFVDIPLGFAPTSYTVRRNDELLCQGRLWPKRRTARPRGQGPGAAIPPRTALTVIVPVYRDEDATKACLASLLADAKDRRNTRIVVVDDASPEPAIAEHLDRLGDTGAIRLVRHANNLGFIGAVSSGLAEAAGSDVLLLNADTVLPPGALDRLADAVYGAADIGTATPFSNNGEYTSFPRHAEASDVSTAEALRIDSAAASVNRGRVVDLPNGVGFCFYIRHDCLAAVGGLSERYHRGYFEDLDFSLRARLAGFRNVCATSVHVIHRGTLSFGAEKRGLVVRNLRLVRQRFPTLEAECAAYARADPLAAARGAIEAEIAPLGGPCLVAGPEASPTAGERLFRLRETGPAPVSLTWRTVGARTLIRIRGSAESGPRSLDFALPEDGERLSRYIAALDPAAIEIAGAILPDRILVDVFADAAQRPDILLGDLPAGLQAATATLKGGAPTSPLTAGWRAWRDALDDRCGRPIALDASSLAAIRAAPSGKSNGSEIIDASIWSGGERSADRSSLRPPGLGVLMAAPSPEADGFVRALSAALRRRDTGARIVVLGRALDDLSLMGRGNVFVSGAVSADGYGDVARHYGVRALALSYCDGHRALLERVASETALPAAFTDWSLQTLAAEPFSLALEPTDRVEDAATRIVDWFADRFTP